MSLLLASRVAMEAVGIRKEPHSAGLHFRRRPSIYVANEFLLALGKARLLEGRLVLLCRTIRASLGLHSPESAHLACRTLLPQVVDSFDFTLMNFNLRHSCPFGDVY